MSLKDSLARMSQLELRLKELGVPSDAVESVMGHIDEYVELRNGLEKERESQFRDDAWGFMAEVKQASNKNVDSLSAFLRKFAQHVAFHTISLTQVHGGDASVIVDHVPPMSDGSDEDVSEN